MSEILEERFVVFIDILGFGAMVRQAARDPDGEMANRVAAALKVIEDLGQSRGDIVFPSKSNSDFHSHAFSDCIVMSVVPSAEVVAELFVVLAKLTLDLMEIGVWIRGGMSHGLISKTRTTPWGPAIVEAYEVESKLAINPRIAMGKSAVEFVNRAATGVQKDDRLVRDDDGVWSLEPFVWVRSDAREKLPYLTKEKARRIKSELESAHEGVVDSPRIFSKIEWLRERWDSQLKPKDGVPIFDCRTELGIEQDSIEDWVTAFETAFKGED
ncbi:hypothetical protein [Jannaschia rubra]|uniref:Guanylate cyclase domain-containing protein n=1 Tax=Jannaschia rubra TaxID=282197 RepID=A0A0M6XK46_9RHOB|nr:hypothetical protein [Jannaschia rubra]CTQ31298.1 hypothetical protein JAN5088_00052 [Jannaschia rubra]SFF82145.1 hypothetical protein SAMN04488517_101365 [Jannaschia rubra]